MVKIKYIGHKPVKTDNVAGTDAVWRGHGDAQEVSSEAAAKLLRFPGVWAAAGEEEAEASKDGQASPGAIDKAALLDRAAALGIKADGRMGVAKLTALIEEAEASKAG